MASLYRKYRPKDFQSVVGQSDTIKNLLNQIKGNKISHAYEFSGTRGTGKTSTAKIFARTINCLNPKDGEPCNECNTCKSIIKGSCLDVIEIDGASNNGVDNIRSLKDNIQYTPSEGKYKVYIIDEVHMLSNGAFNSLLKTLEEPPSYVVFILATTEPHKIPATIRSRCQKFSFKRVSTDAMVSRMKYICSQESVTVSDEALKLIALNSDGALRDALSILDQCTSLYKDNISKEEVINVLGITDTSFIIDMANYLLNKDVNNCLFQIHSVMDMGKDLRVFISDITSIFRDIMLYKSSNNISLVEGIEEYKETIKKLSKLASLNEITYLIKELASLNSQIRYELNPLTLIELNVIRLCNPLDLSVENLMVQISSLKNELELIKRNVSLNNKSINKQNFVPMKPNITVPTDETHNCNDNSLQEDKLSHYKNILATKDDILKNLIANAALSISNNILFIKFEVPAYYLIAKHKYCNLDVGIEYKFVLENM